MSSFNSVRVTQADVADVVRKKADAAGAQGVEVDAVVAEVVERLRDLIGEHTATTALRADTVHLWIEQQIDAAYTKPEFDEVLRPTHHKWAVDPPLPAGMSWD